MQIFHFLRGLKTNLKSKIFNLKNKNKQKFECPICSYVGPFMDLNQPITGSRQHAICPKCGAPERLRLQYLVVNDLLKSIDSSNMKMLHFAPEKILSKIFNHEMGKYETADLNMKGVNFNVDLQSLPFDDSSYDFVFASHVLEHIPDDNKAIAEIRRILRPNGMAILPVPVVCDNTIEYDAPNPNEYGHMRAIGLDYFDRYKKYFSKVELITSDMFLDKYQLFVFEDRTMWPNEKCPLRPSMSGERHIDIIPICYV